MRPTETSAPGFRRALRVLFGAVGFLLLIACANVANIVLARNARASARSPFDPPWAPAAWRLIRQMLTENLLLAAVGGAAGVLLGLWGVQAITALRPTRRCASWNRSRSDGKCWHSASASLP